MPIQTDLSVSPYFDDYSDAKDYYKVLFRPGVAVQTRELNQLQTMLQRQIERFGDNIFKQGSVIDGCEITFHSVFPYVKIKDVETDGTPVNVRMFDGYYVRNQANISPLVASISTVVTGYESQYPDLNTLYIKYLNTGYANVANVSAEVTKFSPDDTLVVYDPDGIIEKVYSTNNSSGFANSDTVVILSALAIQNSSGGTTFTNNFYVGDHINNGTANVQVVGIDTTSNNQAVILRVKPKATDLQVGNPDLWTIGVNSSIQSTNTTPSDVATVVGVVGGGAAATLKTGALGEIDTIAVTQKGAGYLVPPTVSIASKTATTGQIAAANIIAQTFLSEITVSANSTFPVGIGYAMTVGDGVIYQKGYFTRVEEQLVVVEKYANTPDAIVVGFDTTESIINSNQDTSLLDNATGAPNATAPGANRLELTPQLVVLTKDQALANSTFLSIAEFSAGVPYKQTRQTVYNVIGNEIARRTQEESGDYVLDQFLLTTKAPEANNTQTSLQREASYFGINIDPGLAYISGKRVETVGVYDTIIEKGVDTSVVEEATISLNFGSYIRLKEVGGTFIFKTGDTVNLYSNAKQYITTAFGSTPSTSGLGTLIGTARIRSYVHESGTPGTADAVYRLYLFDIQMNSGENFASTKSVFYDGATKGVADIILDGGVAQLKDSNLSTLMYGVGNPAIKNANNITYIYRTSNTYSLATNGVITFSATGGETFPYTGQLSTSQEKDLVIVPLANASAAANIAGALYCNTTSKQVNGISTAFSTELEPGDYLRIGTSTVLQVNTIANDTVLFATAIPTIGQSGANATVFFPQFVPISLERSDRTANVNNTANSFTINVGQAVSGATDVAVTFNVRSSNTTPVTKTVNRNRFVRLRLANNAGKIDGPWCLGVPDVFRLGKVYKGPNATFTEADTTNVVDVTQFFYIDHNQNEDYYDVSYLVKRPESTVSLSSSDYILVKFDHFTIAGEGLKGPGNSGTYPINDTIPLANSSATINTLEIPEVYGVRGAYYDLRDQFDFRPYSSNTVATTTDAAAAPVNPTEPTNAARFPVTDKKYPAPDSFLSVRIENYLGRADRVTIDKNGEFHIIKGVPGAYTVVDQPADSLTVNSLKIPPYPSLPAQMSAETIAFADTKVANEKYVGKRIANYTVNTIISPLQRNNYQPRGYKMTDIGKLERRIEALEYYTSFTIAEQDTQKKSIPSSVDPSVERFKFGYFVDSFTDPSYSAVETPGYAATVVDGYLCPPIKEINLEVALPKEDVSLPYTDQQFISQSSATDGPVTAAAPVPQVVVPVANSSTINFYMAPKKKATYQAISAIRYLIYYTWRFNGPMQASLLAQVQALDNGRGFYSQVVAGHPAAPAAYLYSSVYTLPYWWNYYNYNYYWAPIYF